MAWFLCFLCVGAFLMSASMAMLPLLVLAPQKFASVFTTGSLFVLSSFGILKGAASLISHLTSTARLPFTIAYFLSMAATMYSSLWLRSATLTIPAVAMQVWCLLWFFVSYIPYGQMVFGYIQDALCGCIGRACCPKWVANRGSSIPL